MSLRRRQHVEIDNSAVERALWLELGGRSYLFAGANKWWRVRCRQYRLIEKTAKLNAVSTSKPWLRQTLTHIVNHL